MDNVGSHHVGLPYSRTEFGRFLYHLPCYRCLGSYRCLVRFSFLGTILSVWLIRPKLLRRLHAAGEERLSNADALIGRIGTVIEPILAGESGYVKVDGDEWKAVSNVPETIEKGSKVEIIARDSIIVTVKLI